MNLKNMRECDKSKNTCKQQLPIVYMSFNNVGHLITSTITTLQRFATLYHTSPNYTSLHLSTLHFLSFALHYSPVWLIQYTTQYALYDTVQQYWNTHCCTYRFLQIPWLYFVPTNCFSLTFSICSHFQYV